MFLKVNRTSGLWRKNFQVPSHLLFIVNPSLLHLLLHSMMYKLQQQHRSLDHEFTLFRNSAHHMTWSNQASLTSEIKIQQQQQTKTSTTEYKVSTVTNQAYTFQCSTFSLIVYAKVIQLLVTAMRKTQLETMYWAGLRLSHINSSALMISSWIQREWITKLPSPESQTAGLCSSGGDRDEFNGPGRFRWVLPRPCAVCWASVVRVRSLSSAHAVRVVLGELLHHVLTARETVDTVLQEVATKKHVYPWVAAAVQRGQ